MYSPWSFYPASEEQGEHVLLYIQRISQWFHKTIFFFPKSTEFLKFLRHSNNLKKQHIVLPSTEIKTTNIVFIKESSLSIL